MTVFPANLVPSYGTRVEANHKVAMAAFGDQYEQRGDDGHRPKRLRFQVGFRQVRSVKAKAVKDFLNQVGGVKAFLWTPPAPYDVKKAFIFRPPYAFTWDAFDCETVEFLLDEDMNPAEQVAAPLANVVDQGDGTGLLSASAAVGAVIRYSTTPGAELERPTDGTLYTAPALIPWPGTVTLRAFFATSLDSELKIIT